MTTKALGYALILWNGQQIGQRPRTKLAWITERKGRDLRADIVSDKGLSLYKNARKKVSESVLEEARSAIAKAEASVDPDTLDAMKEIYEADVRGSTNPEKTAEAIDRAAKLGTTAIFKAERGGS